MFEFWIIEFTATCQNLNLKRNLGEVWHVKKWRAYNFLFGVKRLVFCLALTAIFLFSRLLSKVLSSKAHEPFLTKSVLKFCPAGTEPQDRPKCCPSVILETWTCVETMGVDNLSIEKTFSYHMLLMRQSCSSLTVNSFKLRWIADVENGSWGDVRKIDLFSNENQY